MSEAVNHWGMTEEDLGLIDLVRQEIWEWRSVCQSPQHLLALGTIVSGLDALLAGNPPDAASTVSLDHMVGANSRSVSILLDEDALELVHSAHYYDSAIGGDGESEVDVDLSRFDAAPLIAFTATKETDYGTETDGRIPARCGADCPDQWTDAQAGG